MPSKILVPKDLKEHANQCVLVNVCLSPTVKIRILNYNSLWDDGPAVCSTSKKCSVMLAAWRCFVLRYCTCRLAHSLVCSQSAVNSATNIHACLWQQVSKKSHKKAKCQWINQVSWNWWKQWQCNIKQVNNPTH